MFILELGNANEIYLLADLILVIMLINTKSWLCGFNQYGYISQGFLLLFSFISHCVMKMD